MSREWSARVICRASGDKNPQEDIKDLELASLFKKAQLLSDKQKETVKDFLSAFVLKQELTKKLTQ